MNDVDCWLVEASAAPPGEHWLGPRERASLLELTNLRRRADWRLGRWVAKHALRASGLAHELAALEIISAADGAPEPFRDGVPLSRALSLSHRAGHAVALAAPAGSTIGCDLELLESRSAALMRDFFTASERELVSRAADEQLCANTIWSGKESALKALRLGLSRDTRSVEVSLPNPDALAVADGWRQLSVFDLDSGERFAGYFRAHDGFVIAVVGRDLSGPPSLSRA